MKEFLWSIIANICKARTKQNIYFLDSW